MEFGLSLNVTCYLLLMCCLPEPLTVSLFFNLQHQVILVVLFSRRNRSYKSIWWRKCSFSEYNARWDARQFPAEQWDTKFQLPPTRWLHVGSILLAKGKFIVLLWKSRLNRKVGCDISIQLNMLTTHHRRSWGGKQLTSG